MSTRTCPQVRAHGEDFGRTRGGYVLRVMLVGDVCGRAGREAFDRFTPGIRKEKDGLGIFMDQCGLS